MSINAEWLNPGSNIISLVVAGKWTWDEFYSARTAMHAMMDESAHTSIDYILDMSHAPLLPTNVLSHIRNMDRQRHPKSRHMVVVGANRFITTMFDLMNKMLPDGKRSVSMARTRDDAVGLLKNRYEIRT
jgi:hypothetical protein